MGILAKFVLSQGQISLILQAEDHPPIFCCKICSSAILSLAKLTTQIENITIALRSVISSRNGLFNQLRNDSKIIELWREIAACPADTISNNNDDTGSFEEEEFSVKFEPTSEDENCDDDDDTTPAESDDSDGANFDVHAESKYVCTKCQPNVTFTQYDSLIRHMKNKNIHPDISDAYISHLQLRLAPKKFTCKICNMKFARNTDLQRHLRNKKIHPVAAFGKKYVCKTCNATFTRLDGYKRHMTNKNIHPDLSDVAIAAASKKHVTNSNVESEHVCKICQPNVTFTRHDACLRHMRNYHPDRSDASISVVQPRLALKKFICKICNMKFTTNSHLRQHLRNKNIHPDLSDADISVASKRNVTRSNASISVVQPRLATKKFTCKIFNMKFTTNSHLRQHFRNKNIHPGQSDGDLAGGDGRLLQARKIPCKICGMKLSSNWALLCHARSLHRNITPATNSAVSNTTDRLIPLKRNLLPCSKCDKSFCSNWKLLRHKRSIHGQVPFMRKCTRCPRTFAHLSLLQMHMRKCYNVPIVPCKGARHSCAICSKTFVTPTHKNRHVELFHFLDKTCCPYGCPTQFGSEAEWVTHLEGCDSPKMSAESECFCQYCPAVFRNILLQIEHRLRVHPERCYPCSMCGQRLTRLSALRNHGCGMNATTFSESSLETESKYVCLVAAGFKPRSTLKKFTCKICNMKFTTNSHLRQHLRNQNIHPGLSEADIVGLKPGSASKKFTCKICNMKFTRNYHLVQHLRNKNIHPGLSDADISAASKKIVPNWNAESKVCTICQPTVTFTRHDACLRHMRNIHPVRSDASISELQRHVSPKKFACKICNKKFTTNKHLRRDLRNTNIHQHIADTYISGSSPSASLRTSLSQGARPSCAICSKTFSTSGNKNRHVELVHFLDKTSCPYGCATQFGSEAEWVTHLEGCDSPKMSVTSQCLCQYCPAVFRNILLQIEHRLHVHPEKCYACSVCGKKFSRLHFLHDHRCK
ncbi:zinc finger protein Xfin-like [Folsomia candida]|uniref:zinc finger protein Xfin-like n=1 Tax=Folsomia candida TaxID=158441 RepID=UPI00160545E6|nr:zinc finger protein Xfin-like [Folsomia candida]